MPGMRSGVGWVPGINWNRLVLREYVLEIAMLGLALSALIIGGWRRPEAEQHCAPQASSDVPQVDEDGDILRSWSGP